MKFDLRKRGILLALIVVGATVVLWLSSGEAPVATTLRLGKPQPEGFKDEARATNQRSVWFEVSSDRIIKVTKTGYSIEAHTPAGQTNYEAQFLGPGQGAFQTAGTRIFSGAAFPVRVIVPMDTDEFRVKIELEEFGSFYSGFQGWAFHGSGNRFDQAIRGWLFGTLHKGMPATVWSPWVVRSNNGWMEKTER